MTIKEWMIEKINSGLSLDDLKTSENYKKFIFDLKSRCSYQSYKEMISRNFKSATIQQSIEEINEETNEKNSSNEKIKPKISEDDAKKYIEDFINESNKMPSYSDIVDLSKSKNFDVGSFFNLPNIKNVISNIYRIKGLHIEDKLIKEKLLNEIRILKKENQELTRKAFSNEILINIFNEAVKVYEPLDFSGITLNDENRYFEAILLLSDIHWGELVSPEETQGISEYNLTESIKRIDTLFDKLVNNYDVLQTDTINIFLLGDFVDGIIQPDSIRNTEIGIVSSLMTLSDYLSKKIVELSKYFKIIKIKSVVGNHGRILYSGKPNQKNYVDYNFDTIVYEFMKKELVNIVERFDISKAVFDTEEVLGYNFFITHGHIFGGGGNGYQPIPNGISKNMAKFNSVLKELKQNVDYAVCGHFHCSTETLSFDMIPVYVNGSIVGGDEYSLQTLGRSEVPSQTILLVEKNEGVKLKMVLRLI